MLRSFLPSALAAATPPASLKARNTAWCLCSRAWSAGVRLLASSRKASAAAPPKRSKSRTTSSCPCAHASVKAVRPSLSARCASAPRASNSRTSAACPLAAAMWSAVHCCAGSRASMPRGLSWIAMRSAVRSPAMAARWSEEAPWPMVLVAQSRASRRARVLCAAGKGCVCVWPGRETCGCARAGRSLMEAPGLYLRHPCAKKLRALRSGSNGAYYFLHERGRHARTHSSTHAHSVESTRFP